MRQAAFCAQRRAILDARILDAASSAYRYAQQGYTPQQHAYYQQQQQAAYYAQQQQAQAAAAPPPMAKGDSFQLAPTTVNPLDGMFGKKKK